MREIFVSDGSIFVDALTDAGNIAYKESAIELISLFFKYNISGKPIAYIPAEAFIKIKSFFEKIGKTNTISLITQIVGIDSSTIDRQPKVKVSEAMCLLAYKSTLSPANVRLVTNDENTFKRLVEDGGLFFVINSKDAVSIIKHSSFKAD